MTSDGGGPITLCIGVLVKGDGDHEAAVKRIWDRYFAVLVATARRRLRGRASADAEDVALSAFGSFWRRAAGGQLPDLHNSHDLLRMLLHFTKCKALHLARDEQAKKRGGSWVKQEARCDAQGHWGVSPDLAELAVSREPAPESTAMWEEEWARLLGLLDERKQRIATASFIEDMTDGEIGAELGRTRERISQLKRTIRARFYEDWRTRFCDARPPESVDAKAAPSADARPRASAEGPPPGH